MADKEVKVHDGGRVRDRAHDGKCPIEKLDLYTLRASWPTT